MMFFEVTVNGRLLGYIEAKSPHHARRVALAQFPEYVALKVAQVC